MLTPPTETLSLVSRNGIFLLSAEESCLNHSFDFLRQFPENFGVIMKMLSKLLKTWTNCHSLFQLNLRCARVHSATTSHHSNDLHVIRKRQLHFTTGRRGIQWELRQLFFRLWTLQMTFAF